MANNDEKMVVETETVKAKTPVNVLDLLMGADIGKITAPYKDVEITRLSEAFGAPFVVRWVALSPEKYEEVQDIALDISGKNVDMDVSTFQLFTVIEGVEAVVSDDKGELKSGGLLLKNKDLMNKFKAVTPKELCKKLFLSGEMQTLYSTISSLSGFNDEAVKELKN